MLSIPAKFCPCCGILLHVFQTFPHHPPAGNVTALKCLFCLYIPDSLHFPPCNSRCSFSLNIISIYKLTGFCCCFVKLKYATLPKCFSLLHVSFEASPYSFLNLFKLMGYKCSFVTCIDCIAQPLF